MIKLTVKNQVLTKSNALKVVSGTQEYLEVSVNFSDDWDGYTKTIYKNNTITNF